MAALESEVPRDIDYDQWPDARGHFGPYGGRLRRRDADGAAGRTRPRLRATIARDPGVQAELERDLEHYVGRPSPLYLAERLTEQARRRADLPQARRPEPHRRAQDQQHHRPGPAGASAWARRASSPRPAPASTASPPPRSARALGLMRGLHGRGGHRAPGAQRLPHEAAGRRGACPSTSRLADAQGRAQRSDARLGHQRRTTPSTSSARWPARTRTRRWCATSSA